MVVDIIYHSINLKTNVIHGMDHPSTTLCGIHTGFTNVSLIKTDKKITCKRCLKEINQLFKLWDREQEMLQIHESIMEQFDEQIHTTKMIDRDVFA